MLKISYMRTFQEVARDPCCHNSQMTMWVTACIVQHVWVWEWHGCLRDLDPPLILPSKLNNTLISINLKILKDTLFV